MRGEYKIAYQVDGFTKELPPRARRILVGKLLGAWIPGTTSACAENTILFNRHALRFWNYLRVRGEYAAIAKPNAMNGELPPRARRIRR